MDVTEYTEDTNVWMNFTCCGDNCALDDEGKQIFVLIVIPIEINCTDYNVAKAPFSSLPATENVVYGGDTLLADAASTEETSGTIIYPFNDNFWYTPYKFY